MSLIAALLYTNNNCVVKACIVINNFKAEGVTTFVLKTAMLSFHYHAQLREFYIV